jgi:formylglycine-generating enzyme required for sulfatase activity
MLLLGCTPLNGPHRDGGPDTGPARDGTTDTAPPDLKKMADGGHDSSSGTPDAHADRSTPVDSSSGTGCGRFPHGPTMVEVPMLAHTICVDSTEVTQAQYKQFLDAKNGDTTGQGKECASWNTLYAPSAMCSFDPTGHGTFPVDGVDWCDATAFCKWAGKRLCGGPTGALIETDSLTDLDRADLSEWTAACSHGGAQAYPYGTMFNGDACNDGEHMTKPVIVPVETMPLCNGGYPGLFDMMGNVHEWEDACSPLNGAQPTEDDNCWIRGGSYHDVGTSCWSGWPLARKYVDTYCDMGFRCCADP